MQAINDLYAGLPEEIREELMHNEHTAILPTGANLLQPGIAPDHLIIINSGSVESSVEVRGKTLLLGVFGPGHVFGLQSIMSGELPQATVRCLEDCEVTMLPKEVFLSVLSRNPQMYVAVARVLSRDLTNADHLLRDHARTRKTRPGRRVN